MPKFTTPDEIEINYDIAGEDNAKYKLLFISGYGSNLHSWELQFLYFSSLPNYQVVVFDNRGSGLSSIPEPPYSIYEMAGDVIALANHIGWEKFHVVGTCLGGMIGQNVALTFPERVQSLMLFATRIEGGFFNTIPSFYGLISGLKFFWTSDPDRAMNAACELLFPDVYLERKVAEGEGTHKDQIIDLMKRSSVNAPLFHKKGIEGQSEIYNNHMLTTADMKLLKSRLPILAITGDLDIMITSDNSYRMPSLIGAKLVVIGGAGHGVHYQNADEVNRQMGIFIDENFGSSSASNSGRFRRSNSSPILTVDLRK